MMLPNTFFKPIFRLNEKRSDCSRKKRPSASLHDQGPSEEVEGSEAIRAT